MSSPRCFQLLLSCILLVLLVQFPRAQSRPATEDTDTGKKLHRCLECESLWCVLEEKIQTWPVFVLNKLRLSSKQRVSRALIRFIGLMWRLNECLWETRHQKHTKETLTERTDATTDDDFLINFNLLQLRPASLLLLKLRPDKLLSVQTRNRLNSKDYFSLNVLKYQK